jgi:stress-induced-phosphoprotein 1
MREYSKALEALQAASSADTANAHAQEIQAQEFKIQQALFTQRADETEEQTLERAMKDPEVAVSTARYCYYSRLNGKNLNSKSWATP